MLYKLKKPANFFFITNKYLIKLYLKFEKKRETKYIPNNILFNTSETLLMVSSLFLGKRRGP